MATILILDDSVELLEMFEMLFKLKGFGVKTASNFESFTQKMREQKPDLIILDIMQGSRDGRDLCRQLKSQPETKDIPIILMSASPAKLEDHKQHGADDILEKPFTLTDLLGKLNKQLEIKNGN